jgi:hypothetical protein
MNEPIVLSPYAPKTYVGGAGGGDLSPYSTTTYDYSGFF